MSAGNASFDADVVDEPVDCNRGLHLIIGADRGDGPGPTVVLRDIGTFRLETEARETSVTEFAGVVDLGAGGTTTVDRPDSLRVTSGIGPLGGTVEFAADESRLQVSGKEVTDAIIGDGDNVIPNWRERWRALLFPITTSLLAAAVTSFAMFINALTERVGRRQETK